MTFDSALEPGSLSLGAPSPPPPAEPAPVWEKVDPRYVTLQRKTAGIWSAVLSFAWLAGVLGGTAWLELSVSYRNGALAVWAVLTVAHVWWNQYRPALAYRHSSYRIDESGIEIRGGVFFRSVISVPRSRVQHTDVSQGPWERSHGLGTLQIYTAGISHAQIPLPGLEYGRAIAIRDLLLPRDHVVRA